MESLIQPRVMLHSDCPKPSKIGWVWQYTYKAFRARNMHSLKQKHSKTLWKSHPNHRMHVENFSFWLRRMTLLTYLLINALVTATGHLVMQYKNLKCFRGHVVMRWNIKKPYVAYINTYIHKHMYTYTHTISFNLYMRSVKTASDFLFVGSLSNARTLFAMISFNYENTGLKGNKS